MICMVAIMYIERVRYKRAEKTYEQILLRESYRQPGAKRSAVKKRTLLNLTKYPPQLIRAIELALKTLLPSPVQMTMRTMFLESIINGSKSRL